MSIVINNNMMAANASRTLSNTYKKLNTSVQRMASGLRINSAADDAAGLAIRELMRADIATTKQGIRNAADGISMIQTADGALGVIDEKLTRLKELAEQASTGTYTTLQRDMINSEYQAMAKEIDRIANATNFNGIKLLDGSISNLHGGKGLKIHFGTSNNEAEDYYFVNIGDARATSSTGLRVGGDAKNDIWGQGAAGSGPLSGPGCCTAGFSSLNGRAGFTSGDTFAFGYNWDWMENTDSNLLRGKYLAGRYTVGSSDSLQDLIDKVNAGTQSRVGIRIDQLDLQKGIESGGSVAICIGNEAYAFGDQRVIEGGTRQKDVTNFTYSAATYTGTGGTTKFWADELVAQAMNRVRSAMNKAEFDVDLDGASPTSAAVAQAVNDAVNLKASTMVGSYQVLSRAESANTVGVDRVSDQTLLNLASGANRTVAIDGVWGDGSGNWTDDEDIAKMLGWTAPFTVTVNINDSDSAAERRTKVETALKATAIGGAAATKFEKGPAKLNEAGAVSVLGGPVNSTANINRGATTQRTVQEGGVVDATKEVTYVSSAGANAFTATALASAINHNPNSSYWAMTEGDDMLYVFAKNGGDIHNSDKACEVGGGDSRSKQALAGITFENVETGDFHETGTSLTLGGEKWGTLHPVQTKANKGQDVWNLTLNGRDVGDERDLWISNYGELTTPGLNWNIINGMDRDSFVEIQNAADAPWPGADVRTQSAAQEALDAISDAITRKDIVRADLGAMQNRLENTITNLEIQAENLQASESRISDVDVAKEMTEFTKNNVLVQAGVSMLAQANSMSQLALSLLG